MIYGEQNVHRFPNPKGKGGLKRADAVCVGSDHILIVEAKASVATPESARPDPAVRIGMKRAYEGVIQLLDSEILLRQGAIAEVKVDRPLLGIVVTLGRVASTDSPSARRRGASILNEPRLDPDHKHGFEAPICVVPLETIERISAKAETTEPLGLLDEMKAWAVQPYAAVGDLATCMDGRLRGGAAWPAIHDQWWLDFVAAALPEHRNLLADGRITG